MSRRQIFQQFIQAFFSFSFLFFSFLSLSLSSILFFFSRKRMTNGSSDCIWHWHWHWNVSNWTGPHDDLPSPPRAPGGLHFLDGSIYLEGWMRRPSCGIQRCRWHDGAYEAFRREFGRQQFDDDHFMMIPLYDTPYAWSLFGTFFSFFGYMYFFSLRV